MPFHRNKPYPYVMPGNEVPHVMKELQTGLNYFWDLNKLRLIPEDRPYDPCEGLDLQIPCQPSSAPVEPSINPTSQPKPVQAIPSVPNVQPSEEILAQHRLQTRDVQPGDAHPKEVQPSDPQQSQPNPSSEQNLQFSNFDDRPATQPSKSAEDDGGVEKNTEPVVRKGLVSLDEDSDEAEPVQVICIDSEDDDLEEDDKELYDAGEDVEDDDGTAGMEAGMFDAKIYKQTRVLVSLDNIEVPPNTARDLDPSHAASISRGLLKYGSVKNIGDMAVVAKESASNLNPADNELLDMKVYITDGRHRRRAYEIARDKSEEWKEACKTLSTSIWTRVDGQPISFLELLSISTFLNQQSGNVRPITFKDSMYTSVSACKIIQERGGEGNELSLSKLVEHLLKSKALGNLQKKQVRRYAQIALRIGRSTHSYSVFMDTCSRCEKLGAVHVASDVLLQLDDEGFTLALSCLEKRLRSNKRGNFESIRSSFYLRVKELYNGVKEAATRHKKTVREVLEAKMSITRTIFMPVRERIWREMVTFDGSSSAVVKEEPTLSNDKDVIVKGIDAIFSDGERGQEQVQQQAQEQVQQRVEQQVEQQGALQPAGNSTQAVITLEARPSSVPANATAEIRRSTRLAEQVEQPSGSYKEPAGAGRAIYSRKRTAGGGRRTIKRPLQKRDIITALKKNSKEELDSILQSLHLTVVPSTSEQPMDRRDQQQQQEEASLEQEDEDPERKFMPAASGFMDEIVGLPFGYSLPRRYEGPRQPFWCRYANIIPSRWPQKNPITDVEPWLRYLHIPEGHRANVVLKDPQILRSNHYILHYRAAFNYFKEHPLEDVPIDQELFKDISPSLIPWAAAMQYDDVASSYFWERKEELNDVGFTILPGFVDDESMPEKVGRVFMPVMYNEDKKLFKKLREYTLKTFPTAEQLKRGSKRKEWNTIVNRGEEEDFEMNKKGVGRFTSSYKAVTKDMEKKGSVWACVARAMLDVRVGSVVAAMRLHDNTKGGEKLLFTPKTGGRWLMTSKGCQRQTVHTDFPSLSSEEFFSRDSCPGYFTITTGDKEAPLWVCKSSHKLVIFGIDEDIPNDVEMVLIPPYSIAVGRGDVLHAGASFEDSNTNDELLRYHLYFVPSTFKLPDGVFVDTTFKPNFLKPPTTNSSEESSSRDFEQPIKRKRTSKEVSSTERSSKKPRQADLTGSEDVAVQLQKDIFGSDMEE